MQASSLAAAKVPEYRISRPRFCPKLIPDKIKFGFSFFIDKYLLPAMTQSTGVLYFKCVIS